MVDCIGGGRAGAEHLQNADDHLQANLQTRIQQDYVDGPDVYIVQNSLNISVFGAFSQEMGGGGRSRFLFLLDSKYDIVKLSKTNS